ncbi:AraC family transcriptional regulator [Streptacidiphilus rugosus]|uniref:AraC family transcriptional regulator n=1 Tax=Streptacidiphilus rugosus TaxID=405783 RepID=UPI0006925F7D|nr:AraC family transcriptional regulator [Streptacidiphilus rugosus]
MIEGTISTALMRRCLEGLGAAGVSPVRYAGLTGLETETLADDLARVPTSTGAVVWEHLVVAARDTCLTGRLIAHAPVGSLGVWDHLFTSGATVLDGARDAARYFRSVTDPDIDVLEVVENGSQATLRFSCATAEPDVVAAVREFAMMLFLDRVREARRELVVPVHVGLAHRAPRDHGSLIRLLGTRNVEFGAATNSITFLADDAATPLSGFRPGLPEVLRRHADMTLAATRPVLGWRDRFRAAILSADRAETPTVEATARRLALSPRTLQRRLHESGTTFRQELEEVREQRAMRLFEETDLSLQSIATRVGYRDARTLRRAVHRWHGQAPSAVRRESPT